MTVQQMIDRWRGRQMDGWIDRQIKSLSSLGENSDLQIIKNRRQENRPYQRKILQLFKDYQPKSES